jgi:hypothetical protein
MPLAVIWTCLDACDRRDAGMALNNLDTTHAAVAPLMIGEEGKKIYDASHSFFSRIYRPVKIKGLLSRLRNKKRRKA